MSKISNPKDGLFAIINGPNDVLNDLSAVCHSAVDKPVDNIMNIINESGFQFISIAFNLVFTE